MEVDHCPPQPIRCLSGQVQMDSNVVELCVYHSDIFIRRGHDILGSCDQYQNFHIVLQAQILSNISLKPETKENSKLNNNSLSYSHRLNVSEIKAI